MARTKSRTVWHVRDWKVYSATGVGELDSVHATLILLQGHGSLGVNKIQSQTLSAEITFESPRPCRLGITISEDLVHGGEKMSGLLASNEEATVTYRYINSIPAHSINPDSPPVFQQLSARHIESS